MKPKLLVIIGPTATGKTDVAIHLAKKLSGELVACDSRQVYKGLDIGSGKLPSYNSKFIIHNSELNPKENYWIVDDVRIWMYDVADVEKVYSAGEYAQDASRLIENISRENKLPVIVGGSGLYLRALLEGFSIESSNRDLELRDNLEKLSVKELQEKLANLSPLIFQSLNESDKKNKRRLVRRIEILIGSRVNPDTIGVKGQPRYNRGQGSSIEESNVENSFSGIGGSFDVMKIGLTTSPPVLFQRIKSRVESRILQGMIREVEELIKSGVSKNRLRQLGLEYKIITDYLDGVFKSEEEMILFLSTKIKQYSKRQMTWFKKDKNVEWYDVSELGYEGKLEKRVTDWYTSRVKYE